MVDPAVGMESLQDVLLRGMPLPMQQCVSNPEYFLHMDRPNGEVRLTYLRLEGKTVTAFVNCIPVEAYEGLPCFGIGYAVPTELRGQGRAKLAVRTAIEELRLGFGKAGLSDFFVEAIVSKQNLASQRIAEQVLSSSPVETTDELSGEPALQYVLKVTV